MGEIGELGISRFRAQDKKEKREGRVAGNGKENRQKKELAMGHGHRSRKVLGDEGRAVEREVRSL